MNDTITLAPVVSTTLSTTVSDYPRIKSASPEIVLRRIRGVDEGSGCVADKTIRIQHQISKAGKQHSLLAIDVTRRFFAQDASEAYVIPTGLSDNSKVAFQCDLTENTTAAKLVADVKDLIGLLSADDFAMVNALFNAEA